MNTEDRHKYLIDELYNLRRSYLEQIIRKKDELKMLEEFLFQVDMMIKNDEAREETDT